MGDSTGIDKCWDAFPWPIKSIFINQLDCGIIKLDCGLLVFLKVKCIILKKVVKWGQTTRKQKLSGERVGRRHTALEALLS